MSVTGGIMAGIGAAGAIGGAAISSNAASNAADAQSQAAQNAAQLQYQASQNALGFQEQQWQTAQNELQPFYQSGTGALSNLDYLMGVNPPNALPSSTGSAYTGSGTTFSSDMLRPSASIATPNGPITSQYSPIGGTPATASSAAAPSSTVNTNLGAFGSLMKPYSQQFTPPTGLTEENDPGYQARLNLGTQAIQQSAAARGNVLTGGTAKALDTYAQDYASNEYNNVYNRAYQNFATNYNQYEQQQNNEYNRLAAMAGLGQTAANQLSSAGQAASNNVSSNLLNTASQMGLQYNNAAAANASGMVGSANAWSGALNNAGSSLSNLLLLNQLYGGGSGGALTVNPGTGMITSPGY